MITRITYFEVSNGTGPLNTAKVLGNFSNREVAFKFADGKGDWGSRATVQEKHLVIVDTINEQEKVDEDKVRRVALAKLTDAEKRALGL